MPVTYMGTDEPSLTPQKEAPEILNSLMMSRGMLSFDEVSEILGSFCNWESVLCRRVKNPT